MRIKLDIPKLAMCLGAFLGLLLTPAMAVSQNISTNQSEEVSAIFDCRTEEDPTARLACYDQAVSFFKDSQEKGEIVTISKAQVEEVKRDSFGFNIPSLPKLGNLFNRNREPQSAQNISNQTLADSTVSSIETVQTQKDKKTISAPRKAQKTASNRGDFSGINKINVAIKKVQPFGRNKIRVFLENGQVWEQLGSREIRIPKIRNNVPNTANISSASLGSYLMRINDRGTAVRVKRVR